MIKIYKGEKRLIGMSVHRRKDESFEIEEATYKVVDRDNNTVDESDCSIKDNEVYFYIDSSLSNYQARKTYHAWFNVKIKDMPKVLIDKIDFKILESYME